MCGRYALIDGKKVLATFPMLQQAVVGAGVFDRLPQYNAAPMGMMPVVAQREGELRVELMKWWLVPHWASEPKTSFSTFNAKGETLRSSKLFSPYYRGSRCLVPADAFYEWQRVAVPQTERRGKSEEKHPVCIRRRDERPFMFAGLFSVWRKEGGEEELGTFTIITTRPNELLAPIHHRMPAILEEPSFEQWLDRDEKDIDKLDRLIRPYPSEYLKAYRVSRMINTAQNNTPQCLEPVEEEKS